MKFITHYPKLAYFLFNSTFVAILGMLLSHITHGSYDVVSNIVSSFIIGAIITQMYGKRVPKG